MVGQRVDARRAGVLAPVVLCETIVLGGWASPHFEWPTDPFSVIGTGDGAVAVAFNVGLVLAGACWLAYATRVREERGRAVGGLLGAIGAGFVLAGLFAIPHVVHEIGGGVVLFGVPLLLGADALATWRAGESPLALALAAGAIATLVVWLPYDLGLAELQAGYAVLELVALTALVTWTAFTLHRPSGGRPEPRSVGGTTTDGDA